MDYELIRRTAKKIYFSSVVGTDFEKTVELEDLVHAGLQGYLKAQRRLVANEESNPGAYFNKWVYGSTIDFLRKQAMVNLPQKRYQKLKTALTFKKQLEAQGALVEDGQLAEKLGWELAELQELFASVPRVVSAEQDTGGEGGESYNLFDSLVTEQGRAKQLSTALKNEIVDLLESCLAGLKDARQRFILVAKFQEDLTLRELGESFALTEQAIHYQANQGLKQMKSCLQKNGWQWDGTEEDLF